ncbi:hypothetical protein BHM03_00018579 [Ensete ventricosum]|nr:hypothetical protein BHM03_00018579 [Ensete ventricosum]
MGDSIAPLGTTTLPLTIGEEPRTKTLMVVFMVVDLPSAYNAIIGHPTLNRLRAVVSTFHGSMKFPTDAGPMGVSTMLLDCHHTPEETQNDKPEDRPERTQKIHFEPRTDRKRKGNRHQP